MNLVWVQLFMITEKLSRKWRLQKLETEYSCFMVNLSRYTQYIFSLFITGFYSCFMVNLNRYTQYIFILFCKCTFGCWVMSCAMETTKLDELVYSDDFWNIKYMSRRYI